MPRCRTPAEHHVAQRYLSAMPLYAVGLLVLAANIGVARGGDLAWPHSGRFRAGTTVAAYANLLAWTPDRSDRYILRSVLSQVRYSGLRNID
jgi:hypothetical protein